MATIKHTGPAQRWVQEKADGGVDAELGEIFRAVGDESPLSEAALARGGRRLTAHGRRRARSLFRLVPVGIAVLVGGSGAALAEWAKPGILDTRRWFETRAAPSARPTSSATRSERSPTSNEARPALLPPLPPEQSAPPPVAPMRVPEQSAADLSAAALSGAEPSAGAPSNVAIESELLRRALELLRREHDGAAALKVLDEHRARFPAGVLSLESSVARVDALLLLGRRAEALQQLSRLPLERVGRRSELQLLRAELNAERDCSKAIADFDAVIGASAPTALTERALYGRANCRLRLGDAAGSRTDLDTYLSRFPHGRFAPEIRARRSSAGTF